MDGHAFDGVTKGLAGVRSRRSFLKGLVAGAAVLAAGRFRGRRAAAAGNEAVVIAYYDAIQKHSWQKAYNLLGGKFHQRQTLDQFIAGFADTAFTSVDVRGVSNALPGNTYGIDVVVNAWLKNGTPQRFTGRYFVGREGGVAKIVDANLVVADASGSAPLCRAGQLGFTAQADAGAGNRYSAITVTNTGGACTLAGQPGVSLKSGATKLLSGKREPNTTLAPVPLGPGASAVLQLGWTNWCGAGVSGDVAAVITLPGTAGTITVPAAIGVPPCLGAGGSSLRIRPWQNAR